LNFFSNICHQNENSIEKKLARRQLIVQSMNSSIWFIEVKKLFWKYELGDSNHNLGHPLKQSVWKKTVFKTVSSQFIVKVIGIAKLHKTLQFMNIEYTPGKVHPNIATNGNSLCS
jgi:hypothetical protein